MLGDSGLKVFDLKSLKANEKNVLGHMRSLGFTNKDIREMTEATDRGYSELRTVGRETEDRLDLRLSAVSRQLEKQNVQIEKLFLLIQHLQKHEKTSPYQTQPLNTMNKQIRLLQKEASQLRKVPQISLQVSLIRKQISHLQKSIQSAQKSRVKSSVQVI